MTQKKNLTQEQKLVVLESAREIGVRDAAKHIGVHYTTVYGWRKRLEALGEEGFLGLYPDFSNTDKCFKPLWYCS